MNQSQWDQLKEWFGQTLERSAGKRTEFIEKCGDEEVRIELRRLLEAHEQDSAWLSRPALRTLSGSQPDGRAPRFGTDTILARRFRIKSFLARGGMGEVYEAEDLELRETVALKTIRPDIAKDERALGLFRLEIQLARRVTHPNVCRIYDLFQDEAADGSFVNLLSMQLVPGETLARHLKRHGPMPFKTAMPLIEQMAAALSAAHEAGVIHGDFKPGNVILSGPPSNLKAVVMDFGLARSAAETSSEQTGPREGTPRYMAPEQVQGANITPATDVYAMGLLIREMVCDPGSNSAGPWEEALRRCQEWDPARRYGGPAALVQALRSAMRRSTQRRRSSTAVLALAAAVVLAALTFHPWRRRPGVVMPRAEAVAAPAAPQGAANKENRVTYKDAGESSDKAKPAVAAGGVVETSSAPYTKRRVCGAGSNCVTGYAITPDGKSVLMTDYEVTGDLAFRDLNTGQITRLLAKKETYKENPGDIDDAILSADGKRVAYTYDSGVVKDWKPELRVMDARPGAPSRALLNRASDAWYDCDAFSNDGKSLLVEIRNGTDQTEQLAWVSTESGSVKVIKRLGWRSLRARDKASLSPDGKYIAYSAYGTNPKDASSVPDPADRHIYVLWADGSKEIDLPTGGDINSAPVWTADGGHLLFISDRRGNSHDLWLLTISGGQALGDPQLVEENFGDFTFKGRSGSSYFYGQSDPAGFDIFLTRLGPDGKIAATPMRLTERWVDANVGPVWSPDGKSIAFKKKRAGNDPIFDLVIRFLETGEERKFVTGQIQGGHPDWFRDSKSLLTGRAPAAGRPGSPLPTQYFRLDVHTGERSPLPDIFQSANALSSDNKTLYVSTGPDPSNFLGTNRYSEVDLESGKERIIFTAPDPEEQTYGIGLSPDGRILAGFLFRKASPPQRPQPQARLFRVGVDGKDFRELYSFPAGPGQLFQEIEWSADGKYLFFMQPRAAGVQRWKVLRISSEGGEPRETGLELSGPTTTASFDISPDGKQVAYATEQPRSSEMWELQNVLSVLDR